MIPITIRDHSYPWKIFSKFRGPDCQIPWLTMANFPHIVNLTEYAVSVASNHNWQIQCVYQTNAQNFR